MILQWCDYAQSSHLVTTRLAAWARSGQPSATRHCWASQQVAPGARGNWTFSLGVRHTRGRKGALDELPALPIVDDGGAGAGRPTGRVPGMSPAVYGAKFGPAPRRARRPIAGRGGGRPRRLSPRGRAQLSAGHFARVPLPGLSGSGGSGVARQCWFGRKRHCGPTVPSVGSFQRSRLQDDPAVV
jgi:hypothetical protein